MELFMSRVVDLEKVWDGQKYTKDNMVKIGCDGCGGKSICCHDMCDTIVLDPYDIYQLESGLNLSFEELLLGAIELNSSNGLILPNIKKQPHNNGCGYLDSNGRCSIHDFRPGFCRLFPLGRVYDGDDMYYVNQVHECSISNPSKIKVKNWIGINNLSLYEKYAFTWHTFIKKITSAISSMTDVNEIKNINLKVLNTFYLNSYDTERDFYEQFNKRLEVFDI